MIEIQDRDREILRHCYEQQFLVAEHVCMHHYRGKHKSEAYRRLGELTEAGYMECLKPLKGSNFNLYRLTGKGRNIGQGISMHDVPGGRINLNTLEHDILLTIVRYRIAQLWDAVWKPEGTLKMEHGRNPSPDAAIGDGLLTFSSGRRVVIEFEHSLKARERYDRILRNWVKSDLKPLLILYVAYTDQIAERLKDYIQSLEGEKPFGVVTFANLITQQSPEVWTVHGSLAAFSRREL